MSHFCFVHAADIHLDSPLRGLEADPDAPADAIRQATRAAFRNLIDLAIDERAAFVLIAGDLYDGDWQDYRTGLFLVEEAARLGRAGIRLYILHGNHDAASIITRNLRLPDNTRVFSAAKAESFILGDHAVALHGRSFPTRAVTEDLTRSYPPPVPGHLNIGLLHTALGSRDHDDYAPTTVEALIAQGYDYWALGHVHARSHVANTPCHIVFPGNLQGRHVRETGAKGASLVTVEDGRIAAVEHRALDVLRWARPTVDLSPAADVDGALSLIGRTIATELDAAEGRPIALRLTLTGRSAVQPALARDFEDFRQKAIAEGRQHGAGRVWLESLRDETRPLADPALLAERPDVTGRLARIIAEIAADPPADFLGDYAERLRDKLRGIDIPADHLLATGPDEATMARLRAMVLAALAEA
ncbi:metallophosphoesterase family protein [Zavarzinia aquatilis]|uniref:metallophosphoesterase family protein n=1 Tax=Zavarzinia aquatilis TaxID=2211142 RepID=UPI001402AD13|nr:DNA repair exonuclease [Zavarzinia aquatilis]